MKPIEIVKPVEVKEQVKPKEEPKPAPVVEKPKPEPIKVIEEPKVEEVIIPPLELKEKKAPVKFETQAEEDESFQSEEIVFSSDCGD